MGLSECSPSDLRYKSIELLNDSLRKESDRTVEIWNLVFIEYNKDEEGNLQKLQKKCIDTGMGLERIAAVMQNVHDNYDIDLFSTIINKSQGYCGNIENKVAHMIIADHLRSAAFLIAEGMLPGNEGRSYALRRLIRRAACYLPSASRFPTFDLLANAISGTDLPGNDFMSEAPNIKLLFDVIFLALL
ncbi:Alanine--tRNA ligase [Dirofilaria immitis]|nr:Alanine--tRNA ligase [Dirofilaria immitis]